MFFRINTDVFNFGEGAKNEGADFLILSSLSQVNYSYDFLIFVDSKGISIEEENIKSTWTYRLATDIVDKGQSVLMIIRPKVITVFFTLINFIRRNEIQYDYLVTNLGFVDMTPKKREFLLDIELQVPEYFPKEELHLKEMEHYKLNSGETELLYSYEYANIYDLIGKEICERFKLSVLIGVIEFINTIRIERKRPPTFYSQLRASNEFIFNITKSHSNLFFFQYLRSPLAQPEKISYDAVHFTLLGHELLYKSLKNLFENYNI